MFNSLSRQSFRSGGTQSMIWMAEISAQPVYIQILAGEKIRTERIGIQKIASMKSNIVLCFVGFV